MPAQVFREKLTSAETPSCGAAPAQISGADFQEITVPKFKESLVGNFRSLYILNVYQLEFADEQAEIQADILSLRQQSEGWQITIWGTQTEA